MKVLHVSAGAMYGGVERVLVTFASQRALCPELEPHFAVCFEGRLTQELRQTGAAVHILGDARVSSPSTVLRARQALRRVLAQDRYDVAILHLPWAHALFAPVVRAAGAPIVFWMHGFASGRHWYHLHWTELWARATPAALVICNSKATAATAAWLFPKVPTEVLFYPVELPSPARATQGSPVILQVSRLEPWKGHLLHLEALALLPRDLAWRCRFAGGPQRPAEEEYLKTLRARADPDRVEFLGQRSDITAQLASADIFCQPNTGPEPFGIVFIEALAQGLPVVTTKLGAAPEIVNDSCGLLTPPGDARALAEALGSLIRDASLRARLGSEGPRRARLLCDPSRQIGLLHRMLMDL